MTLFNMSNAKKFCYWESFLKLWYVVAGIARNNLELDACHRLNLKAFACKLEITRQRVSLFVIKDSMFILLYIHYQFQTRYTKFKNADDTFVEIIKDNNKNLNVTVPSKLAEKRWSWNVYWYADL